MDIEFIMYKVITLSVLAISILSLIFLTYLGNYCDCQNTLLSKVKHTTVYMILTGLIICIFATYFIEDFSIPVIVLLPIIYIFFEYINDLNKNKCACLIQKPILNSLLLMIRNMIQFTIILVILIVIIIFFNIDKIKKYHRNMSFFDKFEIEYIYESTKTNIENVVFYPLQLKKKPDVVKSVTNFIISLFK